MELKLRKRLNNLPKFDDGFLGYYQELHPVLPIYNGVNTFNYGVQDLTGSSGVTLNQTLQDRFTDPNSDYNQQQIGNINTGNNKEVKIGATSGLKVSSVVGGVANLAQGFIGQLNLVKGTGEMMANAGTQERSIGGVGYTRLNYIDESAEKSAINKGGLSSTIGGVASGASAGAAFGPWGAVVGGVVGGITGLLGWGSSKHKLRKRLENARQMTTRINTGNQAGAMTTALQQDYYSKYGNTQGGVLYANRGKDIMI